MPGLVMDRISPKVARDAELMGDDIIGKYLSKDTQRNMCEKAGSRDPKLWRFLHDRERLCNPRLLGSGTHGVAILVAINGLEYVLKVFKRWKQPGPVYSSYEQAIYTSPLAHESRAYARLASIDKDGIWAARCHGWMKLSDAQLETIATVVSTRDLSRWVVVKDYCTDSTNGSHISQIYANFEIAKQAKILPQDIRIENYRGSRIVDLSSALTYPCPEWSEYWFKHFYNETVDGVFDWFDRQPLHSARSVSQIMFVIGVFAVTFYASSIWYRSRLC